MNEFFSGFRIRLICCGLYRTCTCRLNQQDDSVAAFVSDRPAHSRLPGTSHFVRLHVCPSCASASAFTPVIGVRSASHLSMRIRKLKRKSWYSASFPSNEGGLPTPLRSLSNSASRGSVIFETLFRLRRSAISTNGLRHHE